MKKILPVLPELIASYARIAGFVFIAMLWVPVLNLCTYSPLKIFIGILGICTWLLYLKGVEYCSFLASRVIERHKLKAEQAQLEQVLAKKETTFFYREAPVDYSQTKTQLAEVRAQLVKLDPN